MKNIASALVKAQTEMQTPKKGSVNPFFKNKYADLNDVLQAVLPALNSNGIVLLQPLVNIEGKNFVKTVLMHESGEIFESLAEIFCDKVNNAQAYGSGISYARRYSLSSICGIGSEDDDGQKAVEPVSTITDAKFSELIKQPKETIISYLKALENGQRKCSQVQQLQLENLIKQ